MEACKRFSRRAELFNVSRSATCGLAMVCSWWKNGRQKEPSTLFPTAAISKGKGSSERIKHAVIVLAFVNLEFGTKGLAETAKTKPLLTADRAFATSVSSKQTDRSIDISTATSRENIESRRSRKLDTASNSAATSATERKKEKQDESVDDCSRARCVLRTDAAISESQIKKNCKAMKVCNKGGRSGVECTISDLACPPCVTFADSGCFEYESGSTCPFSGSSYDCTNYWNTDDSSGSKSSGSGSGKSDPSGEAGSGSTPKNTTGNSTASSSSSSGSSVGAAGNAGSAATDDGGSDMSVVFAIIGAAIGVIAVAVIFLTLVRRSRAAHDEEDDMAATPPAMTKDPSSTTGAVTYATYGGRGGGGAGTTEPSVTSYYSQQPQNLPIASPRVAGRAVPASPRVTAGRAVPVSAPRPQPTPTGSVSRAMPVFANKAPLSTPQQQQQQTVYQQAAPVYTSAPAPAVAVYQQAPPHVQDPARRASSPRSRRESYEF